MSAICSCRAILDLHQVVIALNAGARDAHNSGARGELPRQIAAKQRRQQLAHCQIAGAAEQHQVEIRQLLRRRGTIPGSSSQTHSYIWSHRG
jgi:uncharacterized membrane protein YqiK